VLVNDIGRDGSLWTFEVGGDSQHQAITMIIRYGPAAVHVQVEHAGAESDAPDLSSVDMTIQILLDDEFNMDALALIWAIFVDEFSGIPFDEMDGFKATL
jgi:hypothetical protein